MKRYDYSFLKNIYIPVQFLCMTNAIYYLTSKTELKKQENPDIFLSLKKIAMIQSVKSSNEIEGIITSDKRIKEIINENSAPLNHNEQEIAGYRDALKFIHENYQNLSINEETILTLHKILLNQTGLNYGGHYKEENNIIREIRNDGSSFIRFTPVSAKDTPKAMKNLILAYTEARDEAGIDQLLLIPCFILDFLCIHPFKDGNGRISRLLTLLLLYKNGFDIPMYISFEEQINKIKGSYYETLKESSSGWEENTNSYLPFMENFIYSLYTCYKELEDRYLVIRSKKQPKNKLIEGTILNSIIPLSKDEIAKLLPEISISTIELVLSKMIKNNQIKRLGSKKNSKYIKIDK